MKVPELLAPAGSVEAFYAAFEAGADAVYVGIRGWNARAFADNFTIEECSDLLAWADSKGRKVHLALNSLLLTHEIDSLLNLLAEVSALTHFESFGGLIVQDAGVIFIARKFFPDISLHLSTLSGIHNLQGVEQAAGWGVRRVVLARELPLEEVISISRNASIEVEVFIHGALCFSFSGFCMASSFRGGRSGLRGECAQPCRLRFRQGHREGFFLSCNDFSGIRFIPELKRSEVSALKIEGRMKSPDYVATVVRAYRMALDAKPQTEGEEIARAEEILRSAPSRRLSQGFWSVNPSRDVLSPHRSGTSGIWIATIESRKGDKVLLKLKGELKSGDLVRPETSRGREESIRIIDRLCAVKNREKDLVELEGLSDLPAGTKLFLVGRKREGPHLIWKRIRTEITKPVSIPRAVKYFLKDFWEEIPDRRRTIRKGGVQLIIKVPAPELLPVAFHSPARWVILNASLRNLEILAKMRVIEAQKKRLVLSLPSPVVGWTEKMNIYERAVEWFISRGFLLWEINNPCHLEILRKSAKAGRNIGIFGGVRLNVRNPLALSFWAREGCFLVALPPDMSKREFGEFIKYPMPAIPAVTVYSRMPLMVSLLKPDIMENRPFSTTTKKEKYYYLRLSGLSSIYGDRAISLFGKLGELRGMGYYYFVIDVGEGLRDPAKELQRLISGFQQERDDEPFTDCNWNLNFG